MRKTLLYVGILAVLGFGIYWFLVRQDDMPFARSESAFTVEDTSQIGKIFLADRSGDKVTLERTDSGWVVDKTHKALRSTLNLLLTTLKTQSALYPVPQPALNNVIKDLSAEAIKCEIYDRKGEKMRVFYVGGIAVNASGTNMLMEGASKPYIVHVPGFVGYLTPRYSPQLKDWRDRTVFSIPGEEIKTVTLKYFFNPLNSFEAGLDEKDSLYIKADKGIEALGPANLRRVSVYLTAFANVNSEGYLNGLPDMDTTLKTADRHSTIDVIGKHGQHQHADVYWMAVNKRSRNRETTNPEIPDDYDADRLYAVINNNRDTVMIQQFAFRHVFRKAFEFFQQDKPKKELNMKKNMRNVYIDGKE